MHAQAHTPTKRDRELNISDYEIQIYKPSSKPKYLQSEESGSCDGDYVDCCPLSCNVM